jgi:tetratricopeptide (TPR) repeat protein
MNEEALFLAALEKSDPDERKKLLDDACAGNAGLRVRVDALLTAYLAGKDKLEPPAEATGAFSPSASVGTIVAGRYKLLEEIGEGGMGAVWVAEQTEPVRRKVALKLIKPGMDSKSVLARFEAERQALAMMDHPNIAKVLDGGIAGEPGALATGGGRPFFVMEYVKGVPITEYCDATRLSVSDRLQLFVQVCQAVQHAHQKGIIHRDLKPSNILVAPYDDRPVPKVIDFGLAKAMHQPLTDRTLHTAHEAVLGTPRYMSPEQAQLNNLDVDTRSDIYSLGVLLYELLTGTTPLEAQRYKEAAWDEVRRIIREEEPPRPSIRLSSTNTLPSLAACRQTEPANLTRQVRGELDWIVMKSLEKDRNRRYETANGFAMDIQRYLAGEAVLAVPPSVGYRLRKYVRKHRVALVTAAAFALALKAGILVSIWQASRATVAEQVAATERDEAARQRDVAVAAERLASERLAEVTLEKSRAERAEKEKADEAAVARAINDFLLTGLLNQADIANQAFGSDLPSRNRKVTIRELLDRAAKRIEGRFKDQPKTEAMIRQTIADTYRGLSEYELAIPHAERAVALFAEHWGPNHKNALVSKSNLAWLHRLLGQFELAESLFAEVYAGQLAARGPDSPETLKARHNLAWIYHAQGKWEQAGAIYREVLPALSARLGAEDPDTLRCKANLANLYWFRGQLRLAEPLYREVLAARTKRFGLDHPESLASKGSLGRLLEDQGEYDQAESLFKEALGTATSAFGLDDTITLDCRTNLAWHYHARREYARAEPLFVEIVTDSTARLGANHPDTLARKNCLASVSFGLTKARRAEELYREVLAAAAALDPKHHEMLRAKAGLAVILRARGDYEQAAALNREVLTATVEKRGPDHPLTLTSKGNLAATYWSMKRLDLSIPLYKEVLEDRRRVQGAEHPSTLHAAANLGNNYLTANRAIDAIPLLEQAHRGASKHPSLEWVAPTLAEAYVRAGRPSELIKLTAELLEKERARHPAESSAFAARLTEAARRLMKVGAYSTAEALVRESLGIREKLQPNAWMTFDARSLLGGTLTAQKKYAKAEPLLLSGHEGIARRRTTIPLSLRPIRLMEAKERLVRLYDLWDKPAEADKWRQELPPIEMGPQPREAK